MRGSCRQTYFQYVWAGGGVSVSEVCRWEPVEVDPVKHYQPSASLCQRLSVKLRQHGSDTGRAPVSAESVTCCSSLDCFNLLNCSGSVWTPNSLAVFKNWTYEGFIAVLFDLWIADVDVTA